MKIRTDFVTNSSSSSYTINILIKDIDGNEYSASSDPEEIAEEASCEHNLSCTAEELMNVGSVSELADMLINSLQDDYEYDEDEEYEDEEDDPREYPLREIKELREELLQNIEDLSQIETIKLTRIWSAWGEGSSCWATDTDSVPFCYLYEAAQEVLDADGEEKEKAKAKLAAFVLDDTIYSEWGSQFPSGFLGSEVKGSVDWSLLTDDIEEFAKMVVEQELPDNDYAEETTEIDMQNHTIKQEAKYILDGPGDEESNQEIREYIEELQKKGERIDPRVWDMLK